jgi:hypothetical protein
MEEKDQQQRAICRKHKDDKPAGLTVAVVSTDEKR